MLIEASILNSWHDKTCIVSICCLSYNHESYITECLESILSQKTDFGFEVLIHDDASSDGTQMIIKKYTKQFPNIIKPILQTENQRSRLKSGMNPKFNYPRAQGKYIAFCEGDDYWSDADKLQKQVELLNKHKEIGAVVSDYDKFIQHTSKIKRRILSNSYKNLSRGILASKPLFSVALKQTRTVTAMIKKEHVSSFQRSDFLSGVPGDTQLFGHLFLTSKIYFMNECTAVYRVLNESVSHTKSFEKKQQFMHSFNTYMAHVNKNYSLGYKDRRYFKKSLRLFRIRQLAYERKIHRVIIASFLFFMNGHLSRLVIPQIKKAFRK